MERWTNPRPGRVALVSGLCGVGIALCCLVAANRHDTAAAGSPAAGVDLPNVALRMALALALMIALIVAAAAALRFFGRGTGSLRGASRLRVIDHLPLAPKRALYSVQAGGRVVIVGVTEASIHPVLELAADEASRLYPDGGAVATSPSFRDVLRSARSRLGAA